ncbi:hypothetical protein [Virgibacillus ainsalahensis]
MFESRISKLSQIKRVIKMALAARNSVAETSGVNHEELEASLQRMADQIRVIDQKLTMQVDKEVWERFQHQLTEINKTRISVKKVSFPSENGTV